jgi:hypothetical protein
LYEIPSILTQHIPERRHLVRAENGESHVEDGALVGGIVDGATIRVRVDGPVGHVDAAAAADLIGHIPVGGSEDLYEIKNINMY